METVALFIATSFLFLYILLSSIEFGVSFFLLFPRFLPNQSVVQLFINPLWEVSNTLLVFFVVAMFACFPGSIGYLSEALYLPVTIALLLFGVRFVGLLALFYGEASHIFWKAAFFIGSFGAPVVLSGVYVFFLTGLLEFWPPTILAKSFSVLSVSTILLLSSVFFLYVTQQTKTGYSALDRLSHWSFGLFCIAVTGLFFGLYQSAPHIISSKTAVVFGISVYLATAALFAALLFLKRYGWSLLLAMSQCAVLFWGIIMLHSPYLIYPKATLSQAFTSPEAFNIIFISWCIGLVLIVAASLLLYRLFIVPLREIKEK